VGRVRARSQGDRSADVQRDRFLLAQAGDCARQRTAVGQENSIDARTVHKEADEIIAYVKECYASFNAPDTRVLARAAGEQDFQSTRRDSPKLPPGSNQQATPRPRQILNLVARGVDETETPLVALAI
jgi:hypothetical protein